MTNEWNSAEMGNGIERNLDARLAEYYGSALLEQPLEASSWQALVKLSSDQRRVIALRYGADLTEIDIALVLGLPIAHGLRNEIVAELNLIWEAKVPQNQVPVRKRWQKQEDREEKRQKSARIEE